MDGLKCVIKKDIKEILRTGKMALFLILAFGIAFMILGFTVLFSNIPDSLTTELPGLDIESLESMMSTLYPKILSTSIGVFSYYIGFFFSMITIIVSHAILSKELATGKWHLPIQKGYSVKEFILSKCLTYGAFAGVSVFVSYIFYYIVAYTFMERDMSFGNAFISAIILGLDIAFILSYTILMSVGFKNPIIGAISMIGTVMFVTELVRYFSFAKYLPTYSLNFVYDSRTDYIEVIWPILLNVMLLVMTFVITVGRVEKRLGQAERNAS